MISQLQAPATLSPVVEHLITVAKKADWLSQPGRALTHSLLLNTASAAGENRKRVLTD